MVQHQAHPLLMPRINLVSPPNAIHAGEHPVNTIAYLALIGELQNKVTALQNEKTALLGAMQTLERGVKDAARIQRDALPKLPSLDGAELALLYQPLDGVSGDAYHVRSLSDQSIGIGLIDASDHGMPAALLTSSLITALRIEQEKLAGGAPGNSSSVLESMQSQLMAMELSGCEFAAGLHAVYDAGTRRLTFARAGVPYPIHLRADGSALPIVSEGPILGAIEDAAFPTVTIQLEPGDTVIFATDGLEALLASDAATDASPESTLTAWFKSHSQPSIPALFQQLRERLRQTPRQSWHADDVTAIALHVTA